MSKRRNGECSIFAYRNGYAAYAWVTTPDGERKRKWVYGKTHDEVHAKWITLQGQASQGPVPTNVPTVSQYMAYWLREVVERTSRPRPTRDTKRSRGCTSCPTSERDGWTSSRSGTSGNG